MQDGAPSGRKRAGDQLPEDIGQRLRAAREERRIGLRELSRRLGISASALSQIETGRTRPSVRTLYAIGSELQTSLDELLRAAGGRSQAPEAIDRPIAPALADAVVHDDERRTIDLGTGVRWEHLTPPAEPNADFMFVTYDVGSSSSSQPLAVRPAGREYGLVLSGRIRVTLAGDDAHELGPHDSIALDAALPHRIDNIGDEPATAVWCMVGPATG